MNNLDNNMNNSGNVSNNDANNRNPKNLNWYYKNLTEIPTASGTNLNTSEIEGKFENFAKKINKFVNEFKQIKQESWNKDILVKEQNAVRRLYREFGLGEKTDTICNNYRVVQLTYEKDTYEVRVSVDVYEKILKVYRLVITDLPKILHKRTAKIQQEVEEIQHILTKNDFKILDETVQEFLEFGATKKEILETFGIGNNANIHIDRTQQPIETEDNRDLTISDETCEELVNYLQEIEDEKPESKVPTPLQDKPVNILFKKDISRFMLKEGSLEENEVSDWNECIECLANPDKRNSSILEKMQTQLKKVKKKREIYWDKKSTKTNEELEKKIETLKVNVDIMTYAIMKVQKFIIQNKNILQKPLCFDPGSKDDFRLKTDEMKVLNKYWYPKKVEGLNQWNLCIYALAMNENNSTVVYLRMKIMESIQNSLKCLKDFQCRKSRLSGKEKDLLNSIENKMDKAIKKVKKKINKFESDVLLLTTITSPKNDDNQSSISEIQGFLDAGISATDLLSNFTSASIVDEQKWNNRNKQSSQLETEIDITQFLSNCLIATLQVEEGIPKNVVNVVNEWNECIARFANKTDVKKQLEHMQELNRKVRDQFDEYVKIKYYTPEEYKEKKWKLTECHRIATTMGETIVMVFDAFTELKFQRN